MTRTWPGTASKPSLPHVAPRRAVSRSTLRASRVSTPCGARALRELRAPRSSNARTASASPKRQEPAPRNVRRARAKGAPATSTPRRIATCGRASCASRELVADPCPSALRVESTPTVRAGCAASAGIVDPCGARVPAATPTTPARPSSTAWAAGTKRRAPAISGSATAARAGRRTSWLMWPRGARSARRAWSVAGWVARTPEIRSRGPASCHRTSAGRARPSPAGSSSS